MGGPYCGGRRPGMTGSRAQAASPRPLPAFSGSGSLSLITRSIGDTVSTGFTLISSSAGFSSRGSSSADGRGALAAGRLRSGRGDVAGQLLDGRGGDLRQRVVLGLLGLGPLRDGLLDLGLLGDGLLVGDRLRLRPGSSGDRLLDLGLLRDGLLGAGSSRERALGLGRDGLLVRGLRDRLEEAARQLRAVRLGLDRPPRPPVRHGDVARP